MAFASNGDFRLAALAVVLAVSVVYCAFTLAGRSSASQGRERAIRLAASLVALFVGLWGAAVVGTASLFAEAPLRLTGTHWLYPSGISESALIASAISAAMASILGAAAGTAYADRLTRQRTHVIGGNAESPQTEAGFETVEAASTLPRASPLLKTEDETRSPGIGVAFDQPASSLMALGTGLALAAKTVLLFDRNSSSLGSIHSILTGLQMTTLSAMSANEAVERLIAAGVSGLKVDLILLDSNIPGGAPAFIEQLERLERLRRGLPPMIMMLDGTERPTQRERLLTCGVAAFIAKPVWRADLEHAMFKVLSAKSSEAQDTQSAPEEEAANRICGCGVRHVM